MSKKNREIKKHQRKRLFNERPIPEKNQEIKNHQRKRNLLTYEDRVRLAEYHNGEVKKTLPYRIAEKLLHALDGFEKANDDVHLR